LNEYTSIEAKTPLFRHRSLSEYGGGDRSLDRNPEHLREAAEGGMEYGGGEEDVDLRQLERSMWQREKMINFLNLLSYKERQQQQQEPERQQRQRQRPLEMALRG
jgi:hypothetical protein